MNERQSVMQQQVSLGEQMNRACHLQELQRAYESAHAKMCAWAMRLEPLQSTDDQESAALTAMHEYKIARTAYALARLAIERPPQL